MRLFAAPLLLVAMTAIASDYARDGGTADWQCCSDKACTTIISQHTDAVRARDACGKLTDADGLTRYTRSNAFRVTKPGATTPPPATCAPPQPVNLTQPGACPTGTTGSWTQSKTYACVGTTWTAGEWTPATAPAGACVAPAPTPPAPANVTGALSANATNPANYNVTLAWQAVPGTMTYEVYRCTGATCTTFTFLADVPAPSYLNSNIPAGFTYRYKVRAWKPDPAGPYSDVLTIATPVATPPPPAGTGAATLNWTPPTQNTDGTTLTNLAGFRVAYGTAPGGLNSSIQIPNAGLSTYVVNGLAAGTWYFALTAYTSAGYESAPSNVTSKVLQ